MAIRYTESLTGVVPEMLTGFFQAWRTPMKPEKHLRILQQSRHVVLAIDDSSGRVVGTVNALTDGCNCAFVELLEVIPAYRKRGIGKELMARMLQILSQYPCIDLTCHPELQPFYTKFGMVPSTGMVLRDYSRSGPK